jgi:hypothetical protein
MSGCRHFGAGTAGALANSGLVVGGNFGLERCRTSAVGFSGCRGSRAELVIRLSTAGRRELPESRAAGFGGELTPHQRWPAFIR